MIVAHRNDGKASERSSTLLLPCTMTTNTQCTFAVSMTLPADYTLTAELYYETRNPPQDKQHVSFAIPAEDA